MHRQQRDIEVVKAVSGWTVLWVGLGTLFGAGVAKLAINYMTTVPIEVAQEGGK